MDYSNIAKRSCVTDCVVPSCSSLKCSIHEMCILSSQTCGQCPMVSCVALSFSGTDSTSPPALPKGAIAGIVCSVCILLLGMVFLLLKLKKRRQILQEIATQANIKYKSQHEKDIDHTISRFPSNASIQIGLEPTLANIVEIPRETSSPLSSGSDHFFSADDLLRMSYAESINSIPWSDVHPSSTGNHDGGAAIMQANKPVLAIRAKAAVMQYTKQQSFLQPGEFGAARQDGQEATVLRSPQRLSYSGTREHLPAHQISRSVWEEDSDTSSPIERDLIPIERFEAVQEINRLPSSASIVGISSHAQRPTSQSQHQSKPYSEAHASTTLDNYRWLHVDTDLLSNDHGSE